MAYNISSFAGAGAQFFDSNGNVLSGGLIYVYAAGTTTPTTTYTSIGGTVANPNPIVLDSAGRVPAEIWLVGGSTYKFTLKTAAGTLIGTYDNIPAIDDVTQTNNIISVSGVDSLVGTANPSLTTYVTGQAFSFVPTNTNTGPVTIDIDGVGVRNVYYDTTTALAAGAIQAGKICFIEYDGTRFQLINSVTTGQFPDGVITTAKLANLAVTAVKLGNLAVETAKLNDLAVTTAKINDLAVTTAKLNDSAVTTGKIAPANVTPAKLSQPLTQMTAVASTSGTSVDFTGIPSWAKRITVMFYTVGTNGTSLLRIRLGSSGGIESTGYIGDYNPASTNPYYVTDVTDGIPLNAPSTTAAAYTYSGSVTFVNIDGNKWIADGGSKSSAYLIAKVGGFKELAGTLDRIRLTTVGGTDTFDAGIVNVMYE